MKGPAELRHLAGLRSCWLLCPLAFKAAGGSWKWAGPDHKALGKPQYCKQRCPSVNQKEHSHSGMEEGLYKHTHTRKEVVKIITQAKQKGLHSNSNGHNE